MAGADRCADYPGERERCPRPARAGRRRGRALAARGACGRAGELRIAAEGPVVGRLRGPRRADPAEAGDGARTLVGHGGAGRDEGGRCGDDLLRPPSQRPRRHAVQAGRPGDDRRQGEARVRFRRASQRVLHTADRRERAVRRADRHSLERHERAVPRERPAAAAGARQARRDDGAHDREPALHRRRCRRVVAANGAGGDPHSPGLLHRARPEGALRERPGTRKPFDATGHARAHLALLGDRHPRRTRRT